MTNGQILKRVDEILAVLPTTASAVQTAIRYDGEAELSGKIIKAGELLQQLKTDLEDN